MSQRRVDPIVRVLEYFETAPLELAVQALALVRRIMTTREGEKAAAPAKPKRRKRRTKAQMQAATVEPAALVSLRPSLRPSRASKAAAAAVGMAGV